MDWARPWTLSSTGAPSGKGDEIVVATSEGGISTRVKGLFSPRGMSEMRDAGDRWDDTDVAHAASGLKISAPDLDNVLAGTTLRVVNSEEEREEAISAATSESELSIELDEEGGLHKGRHSRRTRGPGEGAAGGRRPHQSASIGKVSRRDVRSA